MTARTRAAAAVLVAAALHFRAAPRVEAGSTAWWLVGLALAVAQGAAFGADDVYRGGRIGVMTFVFPGLLAAALLWPATVRHVLRDHRAITDLAD